MGAEPCRDSRRDLASLGGAHSLALLRFTAFALSAALLASWIGLGSWLAAPPSGAERSEGPARQHQADPS